MSTRFAVLFLIAIVACSNVKNTSVTMESLDQLAVTVHRSTQLSDPEKQAFDEVKSRADNGEYDVTGKTIIQLIADQQAYDADKKAQEEKAAKLASDLRARHEERVRELREAVTIVLIDKGFRSANTEAFEYDSFITFDLVLKNNTKKSVRAVKGTLAFDTPLGDEIYTSNYEDDDSIPATHATEWQGTIKYNQFNDSQVRLRNTDLHNIKLDWQPKLILFTDGSRLEVSQ